jgi:hypothetical protein
VTDTEYRIAPTMNIGTTSQINIVTAATPKIIPAQKELLSSRDSASLYTQLKSGRSGKKSTMKTMSLIIDIYPPYSMELMAN